MTANGDFPRVTDYWRLSIDPAATHTVSKIAINLTSINMLWSNPAGGTGFFVGQTQGINPSDVVASRSDDRTTLTLTFNPGTFGAGDLLTFSNFAFPIQVPVQFEVDADRFEGGVVTVTFDDSSEVTGIFTVGPKLKINHYTGAGLVNADAATR